LRALASIAVVSVICGVGVSPATAATHGLLAHGSIVGDPREDVGSVKDAGVVYVFPPAQDGQLDRTAAGSVAITEANLGITPQAGDLFGASVLQADTNSDGMNDLIVGAPGRNHGAGVVYVIRATSDGTAFDVAHPVILQEGSGGIAGPPHTGDGFGAAMVVGDGFNVPWFAIGAPGATVGTVAGAGDVVIMPLNLDGTQSLTEYAGHDAPGTPQAGDHFGAALSPIAYVLAVGVPGHNVGAATGAGEVDFLGLSTSGNAFPGTGPSFTIVQGANHVPGTAAAGNQFGAAITQPSFANYLAIGAPGQNVGSAVHAGSVTLVPMSAGTARAFTPGVGGMPGHLQSYEHFGAALFGPGNLTFLAGAPGANVGSAAGAGEVFSFAQNTGTTSYDAAHVTMFDESALHQAVRASDGFGAVLGVGSHLAFGLPHKIVNGISDAGEIAFADSYTPGQSMVVQRFTQGSGGVPGTAEAGDEMGGAVPAD
jgi:hypothetical protein